MPRYTPASFWLNAKIRVGWAPFVPATSPTIEGNRGMPSESPWSFKSTHVSNSSKENIVFLVQSQIQTPLGTHVKKTLYVKTKKIFEMLLSSDLLGTLVAAKFYKSFKKLHISANACEHREGHQKRKGDCQGSQNFSSISFSQVLLSKYHFFSSWDFTHTSEIFKGSF